MRSRPASNGVRSRCADPTRYAVLPNSVDPPVAAMSARPPAAKHQRSTVEHRHAIRERGVAIDAFGDLGDGKDSPVSATSLTANPSASGEGACSGISRTVGFTRQTGTFAAPHSDSARRSSARNVMAIVLPVSR